MTLATSHRSYEATSRSCQSSWPKSSPKQADTKSYGNNPGGKQKVGNWVRVCGRHHTRDHYSAILDPNTHGWLHGAAAIARILATVGDTAPIPPSALEYGAKQIAKRQANRARTSYAAAQYGDPDEVLAKVGAIDFYVNADLHYDAWLQVGMMVHSAFGDSDRGYSIWRDWSATSAKHDEDTCQLSGSPSARTAA